MDKITIVFQDDSKNIMESRTIYSREAKDDLQKSLQVVDNILKNAGFKLESHLLKIKNVS